MPGLLDVGELPRVTRSTSGRKPGKWRGHEQMATELRLLASREKDPERRWGMVATREKEGKAQLIASAVKKGEAVGFEHTEGGCFEAKSRKTPEQGRQQVDPKTGKTIIVYDVWVRFVPAD